MSIPVGNKAQGGDFFDREREREELWRYLEGNHILLSGPRRLGKTSLLQRLAEEADERGWLPMLVDVQGIDTAGAFVTELNRAFPDGSVKGYLRVAGAKIDGLLKRLKKVELKIPGGVGGGLELQALPDTPWARPAQNLQKRLSPIPALILIDEFTVFLEKLLARDRAETECLLGWLRAWRLGTGVACRFVFSGSIGFHTLLDRHDPVTSINDAYDFRLRPFRREAALVMLAEEVRREGWKASEEVLAYLCERAGWLSPFYLNLLLTSALDAARDRELETGAADRTLRPGDVDDAYDRLLANRSRFSHWYQRLRRDLPQPELGYALDTLAYTASSDAGLTRRQLLNRLQKREPDPDLRARCLDTALLKLEEDGYLGNQDQRFLFLSFPLRDYWKRNHA